MSWNDFLILALVLEIGVGIGFFMASALSLNKIADLEAKLLECEQDKVGAREKYLTGGNSDVN